MAKNRTHSHRVQSVVVPTPLRAMVFTHDGMLQKSYQALAPAFGIYLEAYGSSYELASQGRLGLFDVVIVCQSMEAFEHEAIFALLREEKKLIYSYLIIDRLPCSILTLVQANERPRLCPQKSPREVLTEIVADFNRAERALAPPKPCLRLSV